MDAALARRMTFHGAIVILLGLLAGFPYALVVTGDLAGSERAWRMAHLEGVLNGLLLLAVAGVGDRLTLGAGAQRWLAWSLVVTAYGNVVAATLAAATGNRGLTPAGPLANLAVYVLFMVAVGAVALGLVLVAVGSRRPIR